MRHRGQEAIKDLSSSQVSQLVKEATLQRNKSLDILRKIKDLSRPPKITNRQFTPQRKPTEEHPAEV
jgi:hypothetical protein